MNKLTQLTNFKQQSTLGGGEKRIEEEHNIALP